MKKVLVVDDTKNIRLLLTKCLELEGFQVMTASDGKQAIEMFEKNSFDLAFLDIKLPEIRGTEVLKRIRDMGINTPVIIITAYATVKNAVECTQMGAVQYLQKPFTADKIKSVLNELYTTECVREQSPDLGKNVRQIESAISRGQFTQALQMLKNTISMEPSDANIYLLFGKAYEGIGDTENAKKFNSIYEVLTNT